MKIIFHHPLPLNPNAKSASGIRPLRMLRAFEDLGYEVDVVSGYTTQRAAAIKNIKKNISNGVKYSFLYAESSTAPTTLTERHHLPIRPFMDFEFFRFCKKNDIPIGLFYRDIYWVFESYGNDLSFLKRSIAKIAYYFDLWVYEQTLRRLYLPSLKMGNYVPIVNKTKFYPLPPGHDSPKIENNSKNEKIKLFYVGGISNHYQLHLLFDVVPDFPEIELTLCTRDAEWNSVKNQYPKNNYNITVINESGKEMQKHLQNCDIAILFVKPQEYREFASPVKLYEYLGFEKPILASSGTLAGEFVRKNNIGWSIPYEKSALVEFFNRILTNKNIIDEVKIMMPAIAEQHTWLVRAQQVAADLTAQ